MGLRAFGMRDGLGARRAEGEGEEEQGGEAMDTS
ncbi:predicted protein [Plenodomus lingam JN3]|uniref:Uncharacterized protein n=1 Tax=Leptosphaeria maculans (strain JN3 / isolate v23.1.3 / race Av1-4-5-6-7-8) TaxID=985895 RepID=E5A7T8_LEPMJ|nr:predicted protein [Plenodomus lingam JN3]CBX99683.1 predicted protein [Plenodomus lingam JN3]